MKIKISQPLCFSEVGKKPNQEDALFPLKGKATSQSRVLMVCDGMGGHENGEVASACVAETIGKLTTQAPLCSAEEMKSCFEVALEKAYENLDALDKDTQGKKMGTTLTFLALCTDGILVAHIGDSRVYQMRKSRGIVFQTRDHSLVNDLVAAGEITEEEAHNHPQRNVITRAIQPHQEYRAKATYKVLTDIRKGDLLMLCCDGITEQLDNDDLCKLMLTDKSLAVRLEDLRKECAKRETRDNNTCYVLEIDDVEGVETADVSVAPIPSPTEKKSNTTIIAAVIIAIVCFIIAMIAFSGSDQDSSKSKAKTEQTQGTITRHHKK